MRYTHRSCDLLRMKTYICVTKGVSQMMWRHISINMDLRLFVNRSTESFGRPLKPQTPRNSYKISTFFKSGYLLGSSAERHVYVTLQTDKWRGRGYLHYTLLQVWFHLLFYGSSVIVIHSSMETEIYTCKIQFKPVYHRIDRRLPAT